VLWIDQDDGASLLQQVVDWVPIHSRRLEGDDLDLLLFEPVVQGQ
jgi:hypothetical protein